MCVGGDVLLGFVPCQASVPICGLASPSRSGYSLRFGASPPPFARFSMACIVPKADVCHSAAASLGKIWKRFRKVLPLSSKDLLAELLLDLRLHIVPDEQLSASDNIGNSRYDIRASEV